jgi:cyanate permease
MTTIAMSGTSWITDLLRGIGFAAEGPDFVGGFFDVGGGFSLAFLNFAGDLSNVTIFTFFATGGPSSLSLP